MPTVDVPRSNLSQEQVIEALRDQLGSRCKIAARGSDTVTVRQNVFSHAKVRISSSGGGTSLHVGPFAVGPLGYTVTMLGLAKRVADALEQAPQLRDGG